MLEHTSSRLRLLSLPELKWLGKHGPSLQVQVARSRMPSTPRLLLELASTARQEL